MLIDERNQTHPIIILKRYMDANSTLGVIYFDEGRNRSVGGVVGGSFDAIVCRAVGRTAKSLFRPVQEAQSLTRD